MKHKPIISTFRPPPMHSHWECVCGETFTERADMPIECPKEIEQRQAYTEMATWQQRAYGESVA